MRFEKCAGAESMVVDSNHDSVCSSSRCRQSTIEGKDRNRVAQTIGLPISWESDCSRTRRAKTKAALVRARGAEIGAVMESAPITPEALLHPFVLGQHVYQLGCMGAERVTVYSQQVRALNLAWALNELGQLTEATRVVIIGGGASGLTAAVALSRFGSSVTLLERTEVLLPRFAGCTQRFLHPHAYDWPAPGSHERRAGLPLMDWVAGPAGEVAAQLRRAWTVESAGVRRIHIQTRCEVTSVDFDKRLVSCVGPGSHEVPFDMLVMAVGVGTERRVAGTPTYWENDAVAQDLVGGPKSVLISGNGDGALVDVVRASILDFDHSQLMMQFLSISQRDTLEEKLAAIEAAASDPNFDLDGSFSRLNLSRIVTFLSDRRRVERKVTWNVSGPKLFRANTMALNRLFVECMRRMGMDVWRGQLDCKKESDRWQASVGEETRTYDLVLLRWGPTNDLAGLLPSTAAPTRTAAAADITRVSWWPDGYFAPRTQSRARTQAPLKYDVVPLQEGFGLESRAWWMNHKGAVVGWTQTLERNDHAFFVWSGAGVPPLLGEIPGLSKTAATSINEKGEYLVTSEGGSGQAFLIRPRGMIVLRSIGARAMPYSVNNNSVVVGWSDDENDLCCRPAIWREGTPALLPDMGFGGVAVQVNDQEHAVGEVRVIKNGPMAAARWRGGSLEVCKAFGPYNSARGFRINADGTATGYFTRNGGQSDFFVWPIGNEPQVITEGEAYGINDDGWVSGRAGVRGAFLWRAGQIHWLDDLIDKPWRMRWPFCLTNDLRIVGEASRNGIDRAVLLVPRFDDDLPAENWTSDT